MLLPMNYGIMEPQSEERMSVMKKLFQMILALSIIIFNPSCSRKEGHANKIKESEERISEKTLIRRAAFSGTFYPSNPDTLEEMVTTFLTNAKKDKNRKRF